MSVFPYLNLNSSDRVKTLSFSYLLYVPWAKEQKLLSLEAKTKDTFCALFSLMLSINKATFTSG